MSKPVTKEGAKAIEEIVIIGNWIKSCTNEIQLDNIDKFLSRKEWLVPKSDTKLVNYHCGIINGMLLTIQERKAFAKKNAKVLAG